MVEQTEVTKEQEEKVDGRTNEGKILVRLGVLEKAQTEILKTLVEHGNKITECSVRR